LPIVGAHEKVMASPGSIDLGGNRAGIYKSDALDATIADRFV
jgi:hypothetical protein